MDDWRVIKEIWEARVIERKKHNYILYPAGVLGNKPLTWNSLEEIRKSGWTGKICVRSKKQIARSKTTFNLSYEQVEDLVRAWRKEGMDERDITFNQSMPDENLTIQGEICYTPWAPASSPWAPTGYSVLYTTVKEPMNLALAKEQKVIDGLSAEHLLRRNLDAQSMLDLERLLTQFPNSAIEFSSYSCAVGDLDRNTIFWEVRNY